MAQLPSVFNDIIRKELISKGVKVHDIPKLLTMEYLTQYEVTGSALNPIIKVIIPETFMIGYGKHMFTSKCKAPYIPQQKLNGVRIFLDVHDNGMFIFIGKITVDNEIGLQVEPAYIKHTNIHHWHDVELTLKYEPHAELKLNFSYLGEKKRHLYMYKGQLMKPVCISVPHILQLTAMVKYIPKYQILIQIFSKLNIAETIYVNSMIGYSVDCICPYPNLRLIIDQAREAKSYAEFILVEFNLLLTSELKADSPKLQQLAEQLPYFDMDQIIMAVKGHYWNIIKVMLERSSVSHQSLIDWIIHNHSAILGAMPDTLLFYIYNWRKSIITERIRTELLLARRVKTAQLLSVIPFKPSKLKNSLNRCNITSI